MLEKRVDNIESKVDSLKDFCTGEFKQIAVSLARLESATVDRNKFFGKNTVKLLAAVVIAVLSALGVTQLPL